MRFQTTKSTSCIAAKLLQKSTMTCTSHNDTLIRSLPFCASSGASSFKNDNFFFNTSHFVNKWQMVSYNLKRQDKVSTTTRAIHKTKMTESAVFSGAAPPEAGWCKFASGGYEVKWYRMQTLQAKQRITLTKCGIKREYGFIACPCQATPCQ